VDFDVTVTARQTPSLSTFWGRFVLTEVLTDQLGGTGYPTYDLLESPQFTATDRAAHSAVMVVG
jgi:hypothetical protein